MTPHLFAQLTNNYNNGTPAPAAAAATAVTLLMMTLLISAILIVIVVSAWKVYTKAGRPGWASLVPIYSQWVMAEIGGKPGWWALLMFIPIVNIVISLLISLGVARNFGKSDVFGIFGLWLFSVIGFPILGFGSATYRGNGPQVPPAAMSSPTPQPPQVG